MICVTTDSIDGKKVLSYRGIVAAEVVFGANFVKDMLSNISDLTGSRSSSYERVFESARTAALDQMKRQAAEMQAHAILTVRFNYQVLGQANGMMMVAGTGTAVQLMKTDEEVAKDEAMQAAETAVHFIEIGGAERGPFSIIQLQELLGIGRITSDSMVRSEGIGSLRCLTELLPKH